MAYLVSFPRYGDTFCFENCHFSHTTPAFDAPITGVLYRNIAITFGTEKQ